VGYQHGASIGKWGRFRPVVFVDWRGIAGWVGRAGRFPTTPDMLAVGKLAWDTWMFSED
jgi:hypothetical protein